jgi:hypothetical protein
VDAKCGDEGKAIPQDAILASAAPRTNSIFVQIYVYDPQDDEGAEADIRLGHMRLQSGTTTAIKRKLLLLLAKLHEWLRKCNPYVQDCI